MRITVRALAGHDIDWAVALYARNNRDALTREQRRQSGFVQGTMSADALRARIDGPVSLVAELDGDPMGMVLTAEPDAHPHGPPALAISAAHEAGIRDAFLYGPAMVDPKARGHGLLRAMTRKVKAYTDRTGRTAVGFVEDGNSASMDAHKALGWNPAAAFTVNEHSFTAIALQ